MGFFHWLRRRICEAVLAGCADAEAILAGDAVESNEQAALTFSGEHGQSKRLVDGRRNNGMKAAAKPAAARPKR